jgi:molecular chaperone GrpE
MSGKPKKVPEPTEEPRPEEDILSELEREVSDLTAALQRERADAINVRRRADEDRVRMGSVHKAAVVRALLPVIDNFDRALKHIPKELEGNDYIKGVAAVVIQFEKALSDMGVQKIKTVGEIFDPEFHEAVSMDEGQGGTKEIVSEELQSGYMLNNEVLRHAMVRVELRP